jgi:hypothetical protein
MPRTLATTDATVLAVTPVAAALATRLTGTPAPDTIIRTSRG